MSEMRFTEFDDRGVLDEQLAVDVAGALRDAILLRGKATLVLSGGSTPKGFLVALARRELDWDKLFVTLVDDRWVASGHSDSNERLVQENLLTGVARAAHFLPIVTDAPHPELALEVITEKLAGLGTADVMILGMGGDGHFASLFPDSAALEAGLELQSGQSFIAVDPPLAPHARMSMTLPRVFDTRRLILHIVGDEKRAVLEQAAREKDPLRLPIAAVLNAVSPSLEVYWAA
ncbi:MAG: 6-phosphogluconolactonase [Congregibacter sp.]